LLLSFAPPKEPRNAKRDELDEVKVTKEKESGKDNLSLFVRPLHRPLPATKQAEVRAFSG